MEAEEKKAKLEKLTLLISTAMSMIKALTDSHEMGDVTIVVGLGTLAAGCAGYLGDASVAVDVCDFLSESAMEDAENDESAPTVAAVVMPVRGLDHNERAMQW